MDYGDAKIIPSTTGTVLVGGLTIGHYWIVLGSLLIVGMGAVLIRLFFRKGKSVTSK